MDWRTFHSLTNHRPEGVSPKESEPGRPAPMDRDRRPLPFKEYESPRSVIQLPDLRKQWFRGELPSELDIEGLSRILLVGAGAKRYRNPQLRGRHFRTYASAGALHPNEIYVATSGLDGLGAGLYHFNPRDKTLITLGEGDPRYLLEEDAVADTPVALIITGIPWRTSWKYRERGYRHLWWDAGMIISNLIALADGGRIPSSVSASFSDDRVNELLGIDGAREMALAFVTLGRGASKGSQDFAPHHLRPLPVGPNPYEFTDITAVHRATATAVQGSTDGSVREGGPWTQLSTDVPVDQVIWRRGSTREFDPDSRTDLDSALKVLRYATAPFSTDWKLGLCDTFVIAHGIDGLEPGAYKWQDDQLHLMRGDADSRDNATVLSLEQSLGGDGAFTVFPMADLEHAADIHGGRGYRIAQLEGAIISGRIYLAAYAAGLGATGLTFYDEEVSKYFGTDSTPMLEVAVGTPEEKKPPVAPLATPQNLDLGEVGEQGVPAQWQPVSRGYRIQTEDGVLSFENLARQPRQGGLWQSVEAGEFRGKRAAFAGEMSSEGDENVAGLFINVMGPNGFAGFDNMWDSPLSGTRPWGPYGVAVDVPEDATTLTIGVWLKAAGVVRFRNFSLTTES